MIELKAGIGIVEHGGKIRLIFLWTPLFGKLGWRILKNVLISTAVYDIAPPTYITPLGVNSLWV